MKCKKVFFIKGIVFVTFLVASAGGCKATQTKRDIDDEKSNSDPSIDAGPDAGADAGADSNVDTDDWHSETCNQAKQTTTTVGCLFYAVDLDAFDGSEKKQYAVAVSNVNQTDTATVEVFQGGTAGWQPIETASVPPMDLHVFRLPDYHQESSGLMVGGSFKVVSDVPIVAYQFAPLDGANSFTSDASMLIPVPSLSENYDIIGWRHTSSGQTYFTIVAVSDGTEVTVTPSVAPVAGGVVPQATTPFTVPMNDGDVLEVATMGGKSLTGSRIASNEGHPVAVFSAHECATIPATVAACDHLEEQMPGIKFWGKKFVAARMPVRTANPKTEVVLWQIYASEDDTKVVLTASSEVVGLPDSPAMLNKGELLEFFASGTQENPGDFLIEADKPIGVMQYMIGSATPKCDGSGDPAMVYVSPVEQFLSRYVVLVPTTWQKDMLIITRAEGVEVLVDDIPIPTGEFTPIADSGYEVARHPTSDGIHTIESTTSDEGVAVVVVGWDGYDSYAYTGGMGLAVINPVVK